MNSGLSLRGLALAAATSCVLTAAPVVTTLAPAPGSTLSAVTSVSVTFSEPVTGVEAPDLQVNGQNAASVTGSGAGPYVFAFTQPAPGTVSLAWDGDHSIAGLGTGVFDASAAGSVGGSSWTLLLTDALAPTVARLTTSVPGQEIDRVQPVPNSTVSVLTQATVFFSEAVSGVDATDLLVNGTPAATVTGDTAGSYVFSFPAPADGTVTFAWVADPAIVDLAGNAFTPGASWSVTKVPSLGTVSITEFLALNGGTGFTVPANGIRDENFDLSPWIELTNTGSTAVDLTGWSLTDDPDAPDRWIFPARTLAAGARLIVWASGKDRKPASGHLHTNFSLDQNGGTLALYPPDSPRTAAASAFVAYPVQRYDYSYGRQAGDGGLRYFTPPTVSQTTYTLPSTGNPTPAAPAVPNGVANPTSALVATATAPKATVKRGLFTEPFKVQLVSPEADTTIRYTLNGSLPTATSAAYAAALDVTGTTVLRFAAFAPGRVPSETVTQSYLFPDTVTAQPSPPYDNPNNTTDNTNPQPPSVGGQNLPVAWGANSTFTAAQTFNNASNLAAGTIPADYGMDPKVHADPNKYNDAGAIDAAGKTNLDRTRQGLRELPALSLVMKIEDMFGDGPLGSASPSGGIYPTSSSGDKTDRTKPCSLELILPDGSTAFAVTAGIDNHGNASRDPFKNPKHGFTLRFKGKYGAGKLDADLFPDSPVHQWDKLVLRADFNSSWRHQSGTAGLAVSNDGYQRPRDIRCRDAWTKDAFRDMGHLAGHHRYTNLFINGVYWGTYDLAEDQGEDFAASYFGGQKDDYDVIDQGVLKSGTWNAYSSLKTLLGWTGGSPTTQPTTAPTAAVFGTAFTNAQYEQLRTMVDVPWFIDYMLLHWFTGHRDWATTTDYNKNWYIVRGKNGKFKFLPWDQENLLWHESEDRVTGMTNFAAGASPSLYPPAAVHPRVKSNAEYRLECADRIHRHCIAPGGSLTPAANIARLDKWTSIVNANAMCLESARWGDYRYKVHQYQAGTFTETYSWNGTWYEGGTTRYNTGVTAANLGTYVPAMTNNWRAEVNRLRTVYFPARTNNLLAQLRTNGLYPTLNAPELRSNADNTLLASQRVPASFALKLQLPSPAPAGTTSAGTIYFTLDGTDPRVPYDTTGQRTATAQAYTAPVTLTATTTVKARTLNGTTWSALNEATFTVGSTLPSVAITEIFYNPRSVQGGTAAEFVEVQNTGATSVDMSGWYFSGVDFVFPQDWVLGPGARAVMASNEQPAVFAAQFPGVLPVGSFGGSLDNGGERLTLRDAKGNAVFTVEYDDENGWPLAADGGGSSLEIIDPTGDPQSPANWRASAEPKGTPGTANAGAPAATVVISEFLARSETAFSAGGAPADFIELTNVSAAPVAIGDWTLWADSESVLLPTTTLAPGASLVVPCRRAVLPAPALNSRLEGSHGVLRLVNLTGNTVDGVRYGPQVPDVSFSRSGGAWVASTPTPGNATPAPLVTAAATAVKINEWLANPAPGEDDWIECFDSDATNPLVLTGLSLLVNGEAARITVPAAVPAGGFARLRLVRGTTRGDSLPIALPAAGASVSLRTPAGDSLDAVAFGAQAEEISQGRLPDGSATVVTLAFPSPGVSNHPALTGTARFHEVLVTNLNGDNAPWARRPGWLELRNDTTAALNLSSWQLRSNGRTWAFPSGTSLAAGEIVAVWCDAAQAPSTASSAHLNSGLALTAPGRVELLNPLGQTADRVTWGNQLPDRSIGRLGDGSWALLASPTRGTANAAAATLGTAATLRINEWFDGSTTPGAKDFVEIHNSGANPVDAAGLWLGDEPSETGRRRQQLPALTFVPAGGFLLVDSSRLTFGIPGTAAYVRLAQNDAGLTALDTVASGFLASASAGRLADGADTLTLLSPTPGYANATTTGPDFTQWPAPLSVPAGTPFTLTVAAPKATAFQWRRNGADLPSQSSATLTVATATLADDGLYTCVATGPSGSNTSPAARVTVLFTYAAWAAENGVGPATGDDDGDGLSNGAEFLAGSDPRSAASPALRTDAGAFGAFESSPGGGVFALDLRLSRRAAFSRLAGQLSPDLSTWTVRVPDAVETLDTDAAGNPRLRLRFAVPEAADRHYVRLFLEP